MNLQLCKEGFSLPQRHELAMKYILNYKRKSPLQHFLVGMKAAYIEETEAINVSLEEVRMLGFVISCRWEAICTALDISFISGC